MRCCLVIIFSSLMLALALPANAIKLPEGSDHSVSLDPLLVNPRAYHINCTITKQEFYDTEPYFQMRINQPHNLKPGGKITYNKKDYKVNESVDINFLTAHTIELDKITPVIKGVALLFTRTAMLDYKIQIQCDAL